MARIRTVKPEFWTDETMAEISRDARLLFLGLLNHVDDEGRCVYNPRLLKAAVFPLDDDITADMVRRWIVELSASARCMVYEVSGHRFLVIPNFLKHQKIDRPSASRHPAPHEGVPVDISAGHVVAAPSIECDSSNIRRALDETSMLDLGSGSRKGIRDHYAPPLEIGAGPQQPESSTSDDGFEQFWTTYPKRNGQRIGKAQALKVWQRMNATDRAKATERLAVYAQSCNGFPKDAERYLRNRLWADLADTPATGAVHDPGWEAFLARHPHLIEESAK